QNAPLPHDSFKSLLSLLRRSSCFVLPQLHARILKSRHSQHPFLLAYAYLASDNLPPPVFLWNETIKGRFREAVDVYDRMLARGVRPDEFTFTFVLPACADARSASEGRRVHGNVLSFGVRLQRLRRNRARRYVWEVWLVPISVPCNEEDGFANKSCGPVWRSMSLGCSSGRLDEAEEFIGNMDVELDAGVWGGLLYAFKIYGHVDIGERVIEQILRIDPGNAG
ncbi:hypothetical protein GW17_00003723, partial [Ensete ventricosum]